MTIRSLASALACALVLAAGPAPLDAQEVFNARPTTPYACDGLIAARGPDRVWVGRFFGQKETGRRFRPVETTRQTRCFVGERDCRNWLYNMLSEHKLMVWASECRRGAN